MNVHAANKEVDEFQRWICRHIVSLVTIYRHLDEEGNPTGPPRISASSGVVMAFGECWFYTTAGHVLRDLDELFAHKQVKIEQCFLYDSLGSQAKYEDCIPFDYANSAHHYRYEEGLDFGFVVLNPNQRRLLEANGIATIGIHNWINLDIDRCTSFVLLGIPAELVAPKEEGGRRGYWIGTLITSLNRLHELPDGAEETEHERFIGEIIRPNELESLEGLSGGPIIGFYKDGDQNRYWIVALQSHSLRNKYVFGCPVKFFGQLLLDELRALIEGGLLASSEE